ncbi:MAG: hypothetical protein A2749_00055 [Parcubacteria group bacterium RIFCSPHIGHO2_01_FULL_45_26]|nr:MAG: hypothetical protein A2749_00055 [Parcubacteria group bacterium RIFCSPHIGHO2_01_FULL_45_26]
MRKGVLVLLFILGTLFGLVFKQINAQSLSDQILDAREKIKELETEIVQTQKELGKTEKEADTLSNTIKSLNLNQRKLETETEATKKRVYATGLSISLLVKQISEHTGNIDRRIMAIAAILRDIQVLGPDSPLEVLLSDSTFSGKLDNIYSLEKLEGKVNDAIIELRNERTKLSNNKTDLEGERDKLLVLKAQLIDQHNLVVTNKKSKESLLSATKNREANYKTLLERKIAQKLAFEAELHAFESKLRNADLSNIPAFGIGVLKWPVVDPQITQYFGNTDFARSNTLVYNGNGHNGIDLRASLGTPIKSAASGRVKGTGNTDLGCTGGSYGKWVLITHNNGLSSLYAHLSLIKVNVGEQVALGDLLGYSGSTGYVTGPHLHFSVYASDGVRIDTLTRADGSRSKCGEMPISPLNGYLNPLLYL